MKLSNKQIKQKYFDKIYEKAPMVQCKCGCGELVKSKDHYGRNRKYINGHNNKKYTDSKQYKREWNSRNRSARQIYKHQYITKFKKELIQNAGSICKICGLEFDGECTSIFDFHHKDPALKSFNINNATLNNKSKASIRKEAIKCELLCANCHRLIHWDWKAINTANSQ